MALLKLVYISTRVVVFRWWKLIVAVLFFSKQFLLVMAPLNLKVSNRSFLLVHWEVFLAQILNSWFMVIRLYYFLNTSWEWSLLLRFFYFLINLLLLREFKACVLVLMHIRLHYILLRRPCFGRRLCSRRLIIWLNALIISFFRLQFLISVARISLSINLGFWSLLNVDFILIVVLVQNLVGVN